MKPLYQRLLKEKYVRLPASVQALHDFEEDAQFEGVCNSQRGTHPVCRFLAWALRLPPTGQEMPLRVSFKQIGKAELWTRHFGPKRFVSLQWEKNGLLYERIRFVTLAFAVRADEEGLALNVRQVYFLGVPVKWLARPKVKAEELDRYGVFCLSIEASLPYFGRLVRYEGWLKRV